MNFSVSLRSRQPNAAGSAGGRSADVLHGRPASCASALAASASRVGESKMNTCLKPEMTVRRLPAAASDEMEESFTDSVEADVLEVNSRAPTYLVAIVTPASPGRTMRSTPIDLPSCMARVANSLRAAAGCRRGGEGAQRRR